MKRIVIYALSLICLSACYKDLGNYHYRFDELNEIKEVKFTPEIADTRLGKLIEFQQPFRKDRKERISVDLEQSKQDNLDGIEFKWIVTYQALGEGGVMENKKDIYNTKGYLDILLKGGQASFYDIQLELRDTKLELSKYIAFKVQTRPIFLNSIFVLHSRGSEAKLGNIEETLSGPVIYLDAYKKLYPEATSNPFESVRKLTYSTHITGRLGGDARLAAFGADGEAKLYDPFGLELKFETPYIFPNDQIVKPQYVSYAGDATLNKGFKGMISDDKHLYIAKNFLAYFQPNSDKPYQAEALAITEGSFVIWDKLSQNFMLASTSGHWQFQEGDARKSSYRSKLVGANVNFDHLSRNLNPQGKTAVYAYTEYRKNFTSTHPFFIFKDEANQYYAYELSPATQGKGGDNNKGSSLGGGKDKNDKSENKDKDKNDKSENKDKDKNDKPEDKDKNKNDKSEDKDKDKNDKSEDKDKDKNDKSEDKDKDKNDKSEDKDKDKNDKSEDKDKDKNDKSEDKDKDKNDKSGEGSPQFTIEGKRLSGIAEGIDPNTIVYNSWFTTSYFFYGAGNSVYRYNIRSGENLRIYTSPDLAHKVSVLKFRTEDAANFLTKLSLYMMIGLTKGDEGAVAEIKLTESADIDKRFEPKYYNQDKDGNVFGAVKDLQYSYRWTWEDPFDKAEEEKKRKAEEEKRNQ